MTKKILSEFIGTAFLLMIIVGSGIMGETLSNDTAIVLLANAIATGAGLITLIWLFEPLSGAHFNPAVSIFMFLKKKLTSSELFLYVIFQVLGGFLGVILANLMFELPAIEMSEKIRAGNNIYLSELIATFGLLLVIAVVSVKNTTAIAPAVGLYITAGYWFTSSTSFANPAVSIARSFTNTFTGISPENILNFILMQILAVFIVYGTTKILLKD